MIPQNFLSTTPIPAPFLAPDNRPREPLMDYELGGIALRDASQGLQVQVWTFSYHDGGVYASAPTVDETLLFEYDDVTAISGAFDQNMNPAVGFVAAGQLVLWWFDTITHLQVFSFFDGEQPRISLDDKRDLERGTSDIVFAYVRGNNFYWRTQRNRFTIESIGKTETGAAVDISGFTFDQMGMNTVGRMQFYFKPIPVEP